MSNEGQRLVGAMSAVIPPLLKYGPIFALSIFGLLLFIEAVVKIELENKP